MPFATSGLAEHDDSLHTGSAKRGAANGVAPLDASAEVPMANLKTGGANELCTLDANAKVPIANLNILAALADGKITAWDAGSDVYHAHDAEVQTGAATYTKLKTITLGFLPNETLRIHFEIRSGSGSDTVYSKVYRNGTPVGTEQSTTSDTYVAFTENISGWNEGDTLELWGYQTGYTNLYVQNFRILCTKTAISNS
ncbi:MAG: hypothetical protein DRP01_08800 [Archaeoglobales archaeon]|nr:MAG: hypothetical protein DRP01_08800 [Archaeoglobales archaeon]